MCVYICVYIYTCVCVYMSVSYSLSSIVLANREYVNCIQQRMLGFADIVFLRVELCFPQRYVQVLTPGVCECSVTKMKVKSLSRVRLLVTLWTAAHQAESLSHVQFFAAPWTVAQSLL